MNVTYMNLSSLLYIYIYIYIYNLLLLYAWIMLLLASIIVYSIYEYLV